MSVSWQLLDVLSLPFGQVSAKAARNLERHTHENYRFTQFVLNIVMPGCDPLKQIGHDEVPS
jgi:hypothetical protein